MVPLIRDELVDTSHFLAMIYLGFSYISVTIYHFILKVHFWRVLASRSCFSTFSLGIFQAWSYSTQFSYTLDWRISIDCRVLNYLPNTLTTSTIASYHFFGHDPLFPSTSCHLFWAGPGEFFLRVDHSTNQDIVEQTYRLLRPDHKA
jgi:hypothetical protein